MSFRLLGSWILITLSIIFTKTLLADETDSSATRDPRAKPGPAPDQAEVDILRQHDIDSREYNGAFSRLWEKYHSTVIASALKRGFTQEEAQDIRTITFLRVHKYVKQFEGRNGAKFSTWFFRLSRNVQNRELENKVKRQNAENNYRESIKDEKVHIKNPRPFASKELQYLELLHFLPDERKREIFTLYYGPEELIHTEIAERTGLGLSTVKMRLVRGRETIKKKVEAIRRARTRPKSSSSYCSNRRSKFTI